MGGVLRSRRFPAVVLLCALLALVALAFAIVARNQEEVEAAFPGASGKIAFISLRNGDIDIYSMNADGSSVTQLTSGPDAKFAPVWSADGAKIAFLNVVFPATWDIYTMNADGSGLTNVTNGSAASPGELTWSPDGSKIAFKNSSDIYVINVDGTGLTNLTSSVGSDDSPAWSPDGTKIAYDNGSDIFVMNADGTGQTNLTGVAGSGTRPDWSPDGLKIAYESSGDIFVMNADGTGQTKVTDSGAIEYWPAWSPDGTKIAYQSAAEVYTMNADGTGVTNPTGGNGGEAPDWQPLPDSPGSNVDLVVKSMKIELETSGFCGFTSTTLGVTALISNTGSEAAGAFVVDVNGAQQTVSGGLAAASQTSLWFTGYVQFDPNVATVDALFQVEETLESNNTLSLQIPVPTLPPTCTPTPGSTATPTPKPPDGDTDGDTIPNSNDPNDDNDACTDTQENGPDETLGGRRDPHNPWDFYDVLGPGAAMPTDGTIDLPNDILGVILHFSPSGTAPYDVQFDRGRSSGPNAWNMTAPDGAIDLPNDILGVILQFNHRCV